MYLIDFENELNNYDFSVTFKDANGNNTILITNDYFKFRLTFNHSYRIVLDRISDASILNDCWKKYIENQHYNFERIFIALTSEYDALENYNGIEEKTDTFNKNYGGTYTSENTDNQNVTGEINDNTNTSDNLNVFNSTSLTKVNEEIKGNTINSTSHTQNTNNKTDTKNDTETGTVTSVINKHGNLGVTTPFQMIEGEKKLRLESLSDTIIDGFINLISYY